MLPSSERRYTTRKPSSSTLPPPDLPRARIYPPVSLSPCHLRSSSHLTSAQPLPSSSRRPLSSALRQVNSVLRTR
nr:unnamed protein product [Digitaria exilis]